MNEDSTIGSLQHDLGRNHAYWMHIHLATVLCFAHVPLRGQRPFSIIKRHIPIIGVAHPGSAETMAEGAAAAEGESVCE